MFQRGKGQKITCVSVRVCVCVCVWRGAAHEVDGGRLAARDADARARVGDLGLDGEQQAPAVRDALAEPEVQLLVVVDPVVERVVPRPPVQRHPRRPERRQVARFSLQKYFC